MVLPARVGVFLHEEDETTRIFVGSAPGAPAYLTGTVTDRSDPHG